jgi:hypothetical protein
VQENGTKKAPDISRLVKGRWPAERHCPFAIRTCLDKFSLNIGVNHAKL